MSARRPVTTLRVLAGVARWLVLVVGLYVVAFQLMALAIGQPESIGEWLGWNSFLFAPGLEYPTAMQVLSVAMSLLVAISIGVWRFVRSRRQVS